MQGFREISPYEWEGNPFHRIHKQWMLIGSKQDGKVNMMTASWGGTGILWNKPVIYAFVRPQRYTRGLIEASGVYSCTFLPERKYQDVLHVCGSKSGRDVDKVKETGLTALEEGGVPYFAEAEAAVLCKVLYTQQLDPAGFLDLSLDAANYPEKDYHHVYVGEILKVLTK